MVHRRIISCWTLAAPSQSIHSSSEPLGPVYTANPSLHAPGGGGVSTGPGLGGDSRMY